jgi:predicted AAA+ superfamily ATPase
LQTIFDAYVLKDIVTIYNLRNVKLAKDILTKIALQIGQEVSLREIASSLQTNVMTVSNYVEIFIKNYILIPLPAFRTNMRRAVSEHKRYYFFDLGIRNILIKDFRNLDLRQDRGSLFENFIISEIEKRRRNYASLISLYFYREYGGKEVDLVVEDYKKIYRCYEIKYSPHRTSRRVFPIPHSFHPINALNYYTRVQKI